MTRIRNPSQLKNMCRPNIIQKIRGSHYDDQSFSLNIDVQLILNFSQENLIFVNFWRKQVCGLFEQPPKKQNGVFCFRFFKKSLTAQSECAIIQMLSEAQTL